MKLNNQTELYILNHLIQTVSSKAGSHFFTTLVKFLAAELEVDYAFIGEMENENTLKSLARCYKGILLENKAWRNSYILKMVQLSKQEHYENNEEFIDDPLFADISIKGLLIFPIIDMKNDFKGIIGIAHNTPLTISELIKSILKICTYQILGELEHKKNEEMLFKSFARYHEIVEQSPESIFIYGEGKIIYSNEAGLKLVGVDSLADLAGSDLLKFIHPDFYQYIENQLMKEVTLGQEKFEGRMVRFDQGVIDVEFYRAPLSSKFEDKKLMQIVIRDISRIKNQEKYDTKLRIRKQKSELLKLVRNTSINNGEISNAIKTIAESGANTLNVERVSVWFFNEERSVAECVELFEWSKDQHSKGPKLRIEGHQAYFDNLKKSTIVTHQDLYEQSIIKPFVFPSTSSILDIPIRDRKEVIGLLSCELGGHNRQWTFDEQSFASSLADMISLTIEKSNQKQTEEQITHLAYFDQLTNLPNRVLLQAELKNALEKAKRNGNKVAIMFFDLDQFKNINDSLGHRFGDLLLSAVAERIKSCVRQVDLIARMGGDEFILVLPKIRDKEDITIVAKRIIESFEKPLVVHDQEFYVTTSIGVSIYPEDGTDQETLIKYADFAMYQAKEKGRNNFEFYLPSMGQKTSEKLIIETNLFKALENKEFELYYQPIIDLRTDKIVGAEALLRWVHPKHGLISPGEFISLSEVTGLIVPIGEGVLREAFIQLKQWQENRSSDFKMSINLSARQLKQSNFIDIIKNIQQETGVKFEDICLEIPESIAVESESYMLDLLVKLRDLGINIAIDDFGKGYSLLSYLHNLPITTLKIDQSFIRDMTQDNKNAMLVKMIIDLAQNFELEVIAEGVEIEPEKELLKNLNCQKGQGYLFSRPIPAQDFEKLLKQNNLITT